MDITVRAIEPGRPDGAGAWRRRLGYAFLLAYLWITMILVGATVHETSMLSLIFFHGPPTLLKILLVAGMPIGFFPFLGVASWLTGVLALVLNWRVRTVRRWMLVSLVMIVIDEAVSLFVLWPQGTLMSSLANSDVNPEQRLDQFMLLFQALRWLRLVLHAAGAGFAFVAFQKAYEQRLTSRKSSTTEVPPPGDLGEAGQPVSG